MYGLAKVRTAPNWHAQTCPDCGDLLDYFGMCPHATPEAAARMKAPVGCGKTITQVLESLHAPKQGTEAA